MSAYGKVLCVALAATLSVVQGVHAQPAGTGFTYQGQLKQDGRPFDGMVDLVFDLYDAPTGGNLIGSHADFGVTVSDGLFTVILNDNGEFGPDAFNGETRWLEILVDFVPMSPRQKITATPYALQTRGIFVDETGDVGIGTNHPAWKLHVAGDVHDGIKISVPDRSDTSAQVVLSAGLEPQYGQGAIFQLNAPSNTVEPNTLLVYNRTNGPLVLGTDNQHRLDITSAGDVGIGTTTPSARLGVVTAGATAISGESSASEGRGVRGYAGAGSGLTYGGHFRSASNEGIGVSGEGYIGGDFVSRAPGGVGVHGNVLFAEPGGGFSFGGRFTNTSPEGTGVSGYVTSFSGETIGARGESNSGAGTGVQGNAYYPSGETYGGRFFSVSGSGTGVFAHATATEGTTSGVTARVDSPDGVAIRAINTSTDWAGPAYAIYATTGGTAGGSSAAVVGYQTAAGNQDTFGVLGTRGEPSDIKALGLPTGGAGVCGYSDRGIGVYGRSSASQFNVVGVLGVAEDAIGVLGDGSEGVTGRGFARQPGDTSAGGFFQGSKTENNPDGRAFGVLAETIETGIDPVDSPCGVQGRGGTAIRGESTVENGNGVVGIANGASGWAIYGKSDVGLAGVFDGTVQVNGTLNAFTKNFLIDHPLDPQNKYLVHSTIESSEQLNSYTGNVVLDGSGKATVPLPEWFEAINTDFRYQLTCIGEFSPVYVSREVGGNSFDIAGGKRGLKVSWTVTAVRNDPYARSHPLAVEKPKPEHERGYYLYPKGFGRGEDRGLLAARAALSEKMQSDPTVIAVREARRRELDARLPKVNHRVSTDGGRVDQAVDDANSLALQATDAKTWGEQR